jgi:hypothetical protein
MGTDTRICPSCGEPNACGLSQGKSECWCFGVTVEKGALARIPAEAQNIVCICARCAASAELSATRQVK